MHRPCRPVAALACGLALLCAAGADAASFDCAKARGKLSRVICADAELSRLDQQVWDAYGARIKTLSATQYAQVRDRHITWRRQRGLYDQGVAALLDDYRRHLAWLTHPLLPLEGRYARADGAELVVEVMVDADPQAAAALVAMGRAGSLHWLPARPDLPANAIEPDQQAGAARQRLVFADGGVGLTPNFIGRPPGLIQDCRLSLRWNDGAAVLATQGACGADLAGAYAQQPPDNPWPRSGRHANAQPAP